MASIGSILSHPVANVGLGLAGGAFDYYSARKEGHGVVRSLGRAATQAIIWGALSPATAVAITFGPALAKGAVSGLYSRYQTNAIESRRMVTPFSHSFSHTDATLRAQQRGLRSIYGGRSYIGASAGMMQQLYGRR